MTYPLSMNLPFDQIESPDEFISMEAIAEICAVVEEVGFASGAVTDHPVPGSRWLDNGGHYAQEPFALLGMIAAVTKTLRLQTNILVLPYRNPFLTARAVSTLDVFSGGRVVLGMGAGYLKAEYKALGVDFDARNDLMDEYIKAMKLAWTGENFSFSGTGYEAPGNRMLPMPAQRPHPPLLIGGNSRRAIRRAVELGDAWHPFFAPSSLAATARTAALSEEEDIDAALAYMREHSEKIGRETPPQVVLSSVTSISRGFSAQKSIDTIELYRSKGAQASGASIISNSRAEWIDLLREFGETVIAKLD